MIKTLLYPKVIDPQVGDYCYVLFDSQNNCAIGEKYTDHYWQVHRIDDLTQETLIYKTQAQALKAQETIQKEYGSPLTVKAAFFHGKRWEVMSIHEAAKRHAEIQKDSLSPHRKELTPEEQEMQKIMEETSPEAIRKAQEYERRIKREEDELDDLGAKFSWERDPDIYSEIWGEQYR